MTVNTLGSESQPGGDSFAPGSSRGSRTVAEWLWPFLVGGVALFSISALFYYHFHRVELQPQSFLQQAFAGLYNTFGWAPSVVFFLLVFAWSLIWFVTGVLEKPVSRVVRLLVMAVMLGVFLNLGDGGVASEPHKGAFGAWIAGRLVGAVGYVPSLVMVWLTTFASLLLATDWFFSEWFERTRKAATLEAGVEEEVTDHLRGLSEIANRPGESAPAAVITIDANDVPEEAAPDGAEPGVSGSPMPADGVETAETAPEGGAVVHAERRLSYAERRRLRAEREAAAAAAEEPVTVPRPEPVGQPEPVEMARAVGSALDAIVEQAKATEASVGDQELAGLLGEDAVAADEAVIIAPEHIEAEEIELVDDAGDEVLGDTSDEADEVAEFEDEEEFEDEDAALDELEEELEDEEREEEGLEGGDLEDEDLEEEDLEEEGLEDEDLEEEDLEEEELEDEDLEEEDLEEEELEGAEVEEAELHDDIGADELEDEGSEDEESEEGDVDEEDYEGDEEAFEDEGGQLEDDEDAGQGEGLEDVEDEVAEDEADEGFEGQAEEDGDEAWEESEVGSDVEPEVEPEVAEETVVAIPRPDEMPEPVMPTPPASPASRAEEEPSAAQRQQKLFGGGVDDDLLEEARDVLRSGRRPTAALLQRKLRIDYELAQDVLRELESRGMLAEDEA